MILNKIQSALIRSIELRQRAGLPNAVLLQGVAGSGKTQLAKFLSSSLGCDMYRYDCRSDKERNILYDYDVQGIVTRTGAFVKGEAWRAFEASNEGVVVFIIDEIDKAAKGFDTFLLRLIEEGEFTAPDGTVIRCVLSNVIFILTSNDNRELEPALRRRLATFIAAAPDKAQLRDILRYHLPNAQSRSIEVVADFMMKQRLIEHDDRLWATAGEGVRCVETFELLSGSEMTSTEVATLIDTILFKGVHYDFKQNIVQAFKTNFTL